MDNKERGRQAAWLLEQESFRQAIDTCALYCQMKWANTAPEDTQQRELFYHQFAAVHSIEEMLKNFVEDGVRQEREENGNE